MRIYLDIETLPSMAPGAIEQVRATVRPPATHKKPETIAAWWLSEGEAAVDRAWRAQALDPAAGELCAIGFAADGDDSPQVLVRQTDEPERSLLERSLTGIEALLEECAVLDGSGVAWPSQPYLIAHHAAFDLAWLRVACWRHRYRPPFELPGAFARCPRDFGDTMQLFAGPRDRISLDALCRSLGIPSPKEGGIDGSKVLDLWLAGDREAIARYCAADVAAVRACWRRLHWEDAA